MLLRSSSSRVLNSLINPLKEGNESDLNLSMRRCKSVQLSPTSAGSMTPVHRQLHIAEDSLGNGLREGEPFASSGFRRAQSEADLQQPKLRSPGRQWSRRCGSRSHGLPALAAPEGLVRLDREISGEIALEEVLRNGKLEESVEGIEDFGSEIQMGCPVSGSERDFLGNGMQSSESFLEDYGRSPSEETPTLGSQNVKDSATAECVERGGTSGSGRKAESFGSVDEDGYSGVGVESTGVALVCKKAAAVHGSEHELGPMYIAGGFGFGDGGGLSGGGGSGGRRGSSGSDSNSTDAYYQKMLEANPGNPLLLRNYARYLHEVQHDLPKAEEYYARAILASPGDGDVLSLYAKLIWDVHKDAPRAKAYFDQAVQAAPDDCYVLGSYAHFLWNTEDDEEEEDCASLQQNMVPPTFYETATATAA